MSTPGTDGGAAPTAADDPLPEALTLARGAADAGLGLKLLGGLAVRVLCPEFPPRLRRDQDIDFACLSKERKKLAAHLESHGCLADRRFNNLNGDRQMYFNAPSGRAIDVLLSKLQIVEMNQKDARDIIHLLSWLPLGGDGTSLDTGRYCAVLGADWGWWRTVTGNLAKLPQWLADHPELEPPGTRFNPLDQIQRLSELADSAPKTVKWRMRASVGDRVRWYELPEEVAH